MLRRKRNGKSLMKNYGYYDRYGRGEATDSKNGGFRRGRMSRSHQHLQQARDPYYRENLNRQTSHVNRGVKSKIRGRKPVSDIRHTRVRGRRCCGG